MEKTNFIKRNLLFILTSFIVTIFSCFATNGYEIGEVIPESDYLTFKAVGGNATITFKPQKGTVLYSVDDGTTWYDLNPDRSVKPISLSEGQSVKFKGSSVKTDLDYHFTIEGSVTASGCVDSLRLNSVGDDENSENASSEDTTFQGLTEKEVYSYMFDHCAGLISSPSLKATDLTKNCYRKMFNYCTNLSTPPELPANSLVEGCYSGMFYECQSLTSAPLLNATVLAPKCYAEMFCKCKNLIDAPALNAISIADECYNNMFYGCTKLKSAPDLRASNLKSNCYKEMFANCSGLDYPPAVSAANLGTGCYDSMFGGTVEFKLSDTPSSYYKYKWVIKVVDSDSSIDSKYTSMFNTSKYNLNLTPDDNGYLTLYSPYSQVGPAFSLKDIIGIVEAESNPIIDSSGYISEMTLRFENASDGDILSIENQDESEKAYIVIKDKDKSSVAYSKPFSLVGEHRNTTPRQQLYIKSPVETSSDEDPDIWNDKTPAPYSVFIEILPAA